MKKRLFIIFFVVNISVLICTAVLAYNIFAQNQTNSPAKERKVLFWYDPMYPNTKFDSPGPSPFMDMDLVPKYADETDKNDIGFTIDTARKQNTGLKTSRARFGNLVYSRTLPASLSYNDHNTAVIQPKAEGFVEKVYPFTVGDSVKKGDPLAEITIPQWVEAQSEYLYSKNKNALERLRLLGMPSENIENLRESLRIQTRFIIKAPISGVIEEFGLREGMNFSKDAIIAKIQSVSPIWIHAYIPESLNFTINKKSSLKATLTAFSNAEFEATDALILPSVDKESKTFMIRAQISNKDGTLKPNMNAYLKISSQSDKMLLIPSSSIIDDGKTQRVITLKSDGVFMPKQIKVLSEANGESAVLGLEENDSVVSSGVFLIDSEANIAGALDKMSPLNATVQNR